ncbi:hypothetical protein M1N58_00955 [Dehalococcoidales bacterium]|nr:hypothetical protein [Dehalococcoidales bacterium]
MEPLTSEDKTEFFRRGLLDWWSRNKRRFPWRETTDPYAVLVAEFLLQKTDVGKAEPAYRKLLEDYPSVTALAQAEDRDLEAVFRAIGLTYRAQRLKKTAAEIAAKYSGEVPKTAEELLSLPGIGRYMANAVLCFAYGKATPLIDMPSSRVLIRFFDFKPAKKRAREDKSFWRFAGSLVPQQCPREYNFALLDFAKAVCAPRTPKCDDCSLSWNCSFNQARGKEFTCGD